MKTNYVIAMSGNDIFSGGGLYADLATYTRHDLHGFVAVTCLTAMTDKGFDVFPTSADQFRYQLNSLKDVPFAAIKIGLLPNAAICQLALDFIKSHPNIPVVLDPVLVCKETHDVEVATLREELVSFFPYVTIITPNLLEAQLLSQKTINSLEDMKEVAKDLYQLGAKHVVIKGGNRFSQEKAIDLFYDGQSFEILDNPVLEQNNVGAGCTFASSIASQLVEGRTALEAVQASKEFVYQAILKSDKYGVKQGDAKK